MKIVRWIVVAGAVLMLLPSDEQGQANLARKAVGTVHYASTTCERHADACAKGRMLWSELGKKAEFAGRVVWDIAFDRKKPEPEVLQPQPQPQRLAQPVQKAATTAPVSLPTRPQSAAPEPKTRLFDGSPKTPLAGGGTLRASDTQIPWQGGRTPEPRGRLAQQGTRVD